jgi:hypothetical protein
MGCKCDKWLSNLFGQFCVISAHQVELLPCQHEKHFDTTQNYHETTTWNFVIYTFPKWDR